MKAIKLALFTLASAFLANCTRIDSPSDIDTSDKEVNHLIIKEVFYLGHIWEKDLSKYEMPNSKQFYDEEQYIVIYNPTNEVLYLDGLGIALSALDPSKLITFAAKDDITIRYFGMSKMAVFPGSGKEHPVQPGGSVVIAKYAIDHSKTWINDQISGMKEDELTDEEIQDELKKLKGYNAFLDLSKADFEWTSIEFSGKNRNNPNIPDMHPMAVDARGPYHEMADLPESGSIALVRVPWTSEQYLKTPKDSKKQVGFTHYVPVTNTDFGDLWATEISFTDVIDVITICPKTSFKMKTCKLDKGFASVTDVPSKNIKKSDLDKYSGLAITRKYDGKKFIDNDNSTFDFEVKSVNGTNPK